MKHTPGPWHPGIGNGEGFIFAGNGRMKLNRNGGTTLYSVCRPTTGYDTAEDDANAQLIAAAPDLLLQLQIAAKRIGLANAEGDPILSAWIDDARAAIDKAEG